LLARGGRQAVGERREHRSARTLFIHVYQGVLSRAFSFTGCTLEETPAGRRRFIPKLKPGGFTSHFALNA
jgi:hypothetical protein